MRTVFFVLAALVIGGGAQAQEPTNLPVSLDHIREGLSKPAPALTLDFEVPSTYQTGVQQKRLDDALKSAELQGGPIPAGGTLMYEQLRMFHNPTNHPLMQPYAAFTGGQMLTLTTEALARRYLEDHAKTLTSKSPE